MALEKEGMVGEWRKVAGTGISLLMGEKKQWILRYIAEGRKEKSSIHLKYMD